MCETVVYPAGSTLAVGAVGAVVAGCMIAEMSAMGL